MGVYCKIGVMSIIGSYRKYVCKYKFLFRLWYSYLVFYLFFYWYLWYFGLEIGELVLCFLIINIIVMDN